MKQDEPIAPDVDVLIRKRIRGLRIAKGWSLDTLAERCFMSPSTLSRIETGHRRIAIDQLVTLARALGTSLDELVESPDADDVVIRPEPEETPGRTMWVLSRESPGGVTVAKMRLTEDFDPGDERRVHPGNDWFTVLSGTARLHIGDHTHIVEAGEAAEFSTLVPHLIEAHDGPVEILTIFDRDGERAHLHDQRA
ncbi:helix-turn-helix domain-containing protein [Paramicrobacterium agarici]|uniref:XRE family transcriptional regulator n=1 Tax=Paramicrobacterium agarici TaxID=630514 RepID=A0A2A9DUD0_9MICO|nr:helix-turn-helix domain-containing protein [Microbacterium agarici]PFG29765.1 XRE family transcriptional regulator [Microbacterium agarici]TQO22785.1 XRE family transcriptional regulator [Microbacterium agarici]